MQGDFDLSKFQLGVLAAMFMVGLMSASVVLTQFMGTISPFRLIGGNQPLQNLWFKGREELFITPATSLLKLTSGDGLPCHLPCWPL